MIIHSPDFLASLSVYLTSDGFVHLHRTSISYAYFSNIIGEAGYLVRCETSPENLDQSSTDATYCTREVTINARSQGS